MHFSTIVATALTFAAITVAAPTENNDQPPSSTCNTSAANKCCNGFSQQTLGGVLSTIGLGCTNIIGSTCSSGSPACCHNANNGLVVVDLCSIAI